MSEKKSKLPARTPEGRENELINMAYNLAMEKLKNGTASSQIIATLLQAGSRKADLEREKLRSDLDVAKAKIKSMEMDGDNKKLYEDVLAALKSYRGSDL